MKNIEEIRRNNLKSVIQKSGMTQNAFCKEYGLLNPNITAMLDGQRPFTEKTARKLESNIGITLGALDEHNSSDLINKNKISIPKYNVKASAGIGEIIVAENIYDYGFFDSHLLDRYGSKQENLAIITVTGKSMMPTLYEDEEILIDLSKINKMDNRLFVISTRNELWVKRMRITPNGYIFESDNEDYRYLDHLYNDTTTVRIVGLVLRSLGRDV